MHERAGKIRCAVYTRKSTEDGLDQEFNSLDAQREACAAYVLSQRHEGWTLVSELYDDGGFSGGNMDRPGLKRLLADVAAGKVDVIVIYKVDRLTRSLADFAKIVDILDAAKASFVSITQAFNTTSSMGRLTLNMLLSFAQFEREVTGERIRDKIAASKRKGLWMGGPVPLGYDVRERKLVVNEAEAGKVRHIMQRYLALGSVRELIEELDHDNCVTKIQHRTSGPHRGGIPFRRGTLFHLLKNRIYLGEIVHKGVAHPGEHTAIVERSLWDQVQTALAERAAGPSRRSGFRHPSLLAGLISDGHGRPMTPTHAVKGNRRYRYYVTRPDQRGSEPAWRVPAHDIEAIITDRLAALLLDRTQLHDLVTRDGGDAAAVQTTFKQGDLAATTLRSGLPSDRIQLVQALVGSVLLHEDRVDIEMSVSGLQLALGMPFGEAAEDADPLTLPCCAVRIRQGREIRLVIPGPSAGRLLPARDEKLIALIAEAHAARELVLASPDRSLNRIAADAGRCRTRLGRLFALGHLAPSIVTAIMEGRQPADLSHRQLLAVDLPTDWAAQRVLLGFA
jgi:DNA invertase Pin-like site-specific DNA recombinase